ncbi:hypothetical protein D3C80_1472150 [compost metagenome]
MALGLVCHILAAHRPIAVTGDIDLAAELALGSETGRTASPHLALGDIRHLDIGDLSLTHIDTGVLRRQPEIAIEYTARLRADLIAKMAVDKVFHPLDTERDGSGGTTDAAP